jgi:hypothetical protein
MANDAEHFFMYLSAIYTSFWVMCLSKSFCPVFNWIACFLTVEFKDFLIYPAFKSFTGDTIIYRYFSQPEA